MVPHYGSYMIFKFGQPGIRHGTSLELQETRNRDHSGNNSFRLSDSTNGAKKFKVARTDNILLTYELTPFQIMDI